MLLGPAMLADRWHIGPRSGQTALSQIMATTIGRHWAHYVMSLTITLVLALAANTSFRAPPGTSTNCAARRPVEAAAPSVCQCVLIQSRLRVVRSRYGVSR